MMTASEWIKYWEGLRSLLINCFEVTKNKKDQNFYKILANETLKAPNNCYKAHSRAFILLCILLYIVIDSIDSMAVWYDKYELAS